MVIDIDDVSALEVVQAGPVQAVALQYDERVECALQSRAKMQ